MKSQEIRYIEATTRAIHSLNSYKKAGYIKMVQSSRSTDPEEIIPEMKHSLGIRKNDVSHNWALREFISNCIQR